MSQYIDELIKEIHDSVPYKLPEMPPLKDILFSDLPQEEQYWRHQEFPKIKIIENAKNKAVRWEYANMTKEEGQEYEISELMKRINGVWFMNNGEPTYITGHHYFFLQYFKLAEGFAEYRDNHRLRFYAWDLEEKNTFSLGAIFTKCRREGISALGIAIGLNSCLLNSNFNFGIVSQDGKKALGLFNRVHYAYKHLPLFAKPPINDKLKNSIFFVNPLKSTNQQFDENEELNSRIDWKNTTVGAYDSEKLGFLIVDEIGKWKDVDVNRFIETHTPCVMQGVRIVGKIFGCSTTGADESEDKVDDRALTRFSKLVKDSNPKLRDDNGFTRSKLTSYFMPAWYALEGYYDKFGVPVVGTPNARQKDYFLELQKKGYAVNPKAGAYDFLLNTRKNLDGSRLANTKRLFPFTEKEALELGNAYSSFDVDKINDQIEWARQQIELNKSAVIQGNFEWIQFGKEVAFIPNENGRFLVSWLPDKAKQNKQRTVNGLPYPELETDGVIGCDPVDQTVTVSKGSMYAGYGFRYFNPNEPLKSDCFFFEYVNRLTVPDIMHEDMLKACIFYGMKLLPERAKNNVIDFFRNRGFVNYISGRIQDAITSQGKPQELGQPTADVKTRNFLIGALSGYVFFNMGYNEELQGYKNNLFINQMKQFIAFEPDDWEPYDSCVATMLCLGADKNKEFTIKKEKKVISLGFKKVKR